MIAAVLGLRVDVLMLGVITGMLYGILGVGLVLVYRSSRIINFAYGDIGAFGAALLGVAVRSWGVPYWVAFALALVAGAVIAAVAEMLVIRRLAAAPIVISVVATLGLGQVLQAASQIISGSGAGLGAQNSFPQPTGFPQFEVGALLLTPAHTAMLLLTPFVVVGLAVFLRRGRLGIALRASAANPDAARMAGMLAGRLSALAWAIAGAVAAFTAVLVLPTRGYTTGEFLGPDLLLRGLACAVVARMESLPAALGAGIGLGVVEQVLLSRYSSGGVVEMVVFVIIMAALLLQPRVTGRGEDKGSWSLVEAFAPLPRSYLQVPAIRRLGFRLALAAAAAGLVIPELTSNATATACTIVVAFGIVGLSVALITGLGGQLSLGQFAIAAVGGVACSAASSHHVPFVFAVAFAAAVSAAVSLVIGLPALRIRGLMLAVATLGFALAAASWLLEQPWMLGTGRFSRAPALGHYRFDTGHSFYVVAFVTLMVALWLARNVWVSGVGRRLRAVRDNEDAARAFSVAATGVKVQTFLLGGALAGLGGAVYATMLTQQTIDAYPVAASINAAVVSVIGGLGILVGPLIGSLYLIGLPSWIPLDNAGLAFTASGWLLLVLLHPGGIGQTFARIRDRVVDALARRAGLDPASERSVTPGGGMYAAVGLRLAPPPPRSTPDGEVLLRADGLTKRFGSLVAVDNVSLEVRAGEILGLIGPNGAGKTTLFELLGGFNRPDAGSITFGGRDITRTSPERRAELGLIRSFQDAALFPTMTVHEVVMLALERADPTRFVPAMVGLGRRGDRRRADAADELLATLGLLSFRDNKVMQLSTGTRRITELACMVALQPVLLLLDEPSSGVAQKDTEALGEVLRDVKRQLDLTLVVIEHDMPLVMGLSDRVMAMVSGSAIKVGSPAEVQADPRVISSYLGGDIRAIARSGRTNGHEAARPSPVRYDERCGATTRAGSPCLRPAGPDGVCHQHRRVLAEP